MPSHDKTEAADPPIDPALLIQTAVDQLADSSAGFLVSGDKVQATDQLHLDVAQINPNPHCHPEPVILDTPPRTELEKKLYKAYQEELMHGAYQEGVIVGYRSALVLQNVYCEKVHRQVAAAETKVAKSKEKKGWLPRDGHRREWCVHGSCGQAV